MRYGTHKRTILDNSTALAVAATEADATTIATLLNALEGELTRLHAANDGAERKPLPIGECSRCHTPIYTSEGFCGHCEPHKS